MPALRLWSALLALPVASALACQAPGPPRAGAGAVTREGDRAASPGPENPENPENPEKNLEKDQATRVLGAEAGGLTTADVAHFPQPGLLQPTHLAFAPGDRGITYLRSPDASLHTQLYLFDPATGRERLLAEPPGGGETEENLSPEEKLRRERQRVRSLGITRYAWTHREAATPRILVPLRGGIFVLDVLDVPDVPDDPEGKKTKTLREVVAPGPKPALDPRFSRDGAQIAYVYDDELYVVPTAGGSPRQLTRGARGTGRSHGLAEYIAQEEMGRSRGYWWSRDGASIAFTAVDETAIPRYPIVHQGKDTTGPEAYEEHGYPFAGAANAVVRLGVVSSRGGAPRWLDLRGEAAGEDEYLARVHWLADGRVVAEVEDRAQRLLRLLAFDPRSGRRQELLRETSEVWINLHDAFHALPLAESLGAASGGFVWASERTGFRHLYLYDREGALVRPLTAGEWPVDAVVSVDEEAGVVYFTAGREDPREHHLYAVPLAGGEPRRLTTAAGTHHGIIDPGHTRFIDVFSAPDQPPTLTLRRISDGEAVASLPVPEDPRLGEMELPPPELVELDSRDGVRLYGAIYRPPVERFGPGPYPTMVAVYGGPHAQRVTRSWGLTVDMRAQLLASQGILVFKLDNRGSARRGLAFEGAIRGDLGKIELADQVDGVTWLSHQGLTDSHRVGIYGWSYGGYLAAMALGRAPETFKIAIAGAPVTHWDGYDTHYTERYMGLPAANPEGYRASSVMAHVDRIDGDLMLVHGLLDENVHFRHTARLITAMIAARKPYELLLFPDERHMPRGREDRVFMEDRLLAFIRERLVESRR